MDRREQLVVSAANVFFDKGYPAGATGLIATQAGMSQASVYNWFDSKADLLAEIAYQVSTRFSEALDRALTGNHSPVERLSRIIAAFVKSMAHNQVAFAVYWKEYRWIPKDAKKQARELEKSFVARVQGVVEEAQAEGVLPAQHDSYMLTEGILGMLSWMQYWYRPRQHTQKQVAAAFEALIGLDVPPVHDQPGEKQRRLVDSAAQVFFRRGFTAGTTAEIAQLAGMKQSSLFTYVKSKPELMGAIAEQVSTHFTEALDKVLPPTSAVTLGRIISAFVESMVDNQKAFAVYWKEYRWIPEAAAKRARELEKSFVARVQRVVEDAQIEGVLPAQHDAYILTEGILGMMSWMQYWYRPRQHTPLQASAAFRALIGLNKE
ncbi:TetR family transcriptional regulator [Streptomyces rhizosphaericus]|uniref:TetR family transcriptional regulator n=1 Tax=Streptomyces rhizosphaericus TaxID=114699 RepID=UPI00142E3BF5|nr:TetR family transcriptional regulator [Streptomyces rhizosphaericus]